MLWALERDGSVVDITGAGRGRVISNTYVFEAVLLLPAGSSTPPSGMEAVRLPAARSETSNVNSMPVPPAGSGSDTVPPDTDMSEAVNAAWSTGTPKVHREGHAGGVDRG